MSLYARLFRILSFGTLALIALLLVITTVIGKWSGQTWVYERIYTAWWMIALWAVVALSGMLYLLRLRMWKRVCTFGVHIALLLILVGALITHLFGLQGSLHLREGASPTKECYVTDGSVRQFPFSVSLVDFMVEYYPGTQVPMDYVSRLVISDKRTGDVQGAVSMNHIFVYRNWRFYQSDYDKDGLGSVLSVSRDPYGIVVTYAGYLLLMLSMLLFFVQPGSSFRRLLQRVSTSRTMWIFSSVIIVVAFAAGAFVASGAGVDDAGYIAPILRSPFLGIHVTLIMASYLLLAVVMLIGVVAVVWHRCCAKNCDLIAQLGVISRLLLYPAVFSLAIGIFLGAVWANVSWGRYWGWDPKEVWALVTLIIYAAPFHSQSLVWLDLPMALHRYCIAAFLCVVVTYFGVNFLLGGLHSYA